MLQVAKNKLLWDTERPVDTEWEDLWDHKSSQQKTQGQGKNMPYKKC